MYDDAGSDGPSNLDLDSDVTYDHAAAHASLLKHVAFVGKLCLVFVPLLVSITLYYLFPSRFLTLTLTSSIDSRARSPGVMPTPIRRHARNLWPFKDK